ncbi:hypothetical protein OPV22_020776 [Ensete ventricosum]|uniref:Uncharacterized protein n=1 Tax=Ensete ventricosum TaxID=4639 RepID=A0AAV8QBA1_ENSVE|nr:hypothetical protein OPV22_020776 [Ensete ventricosum]
MRFYWLFVRQRFVPRELNQPETCQFAATSWSRMQAKIHVHGPPPRTNGQLCLLQETRHHWEPCLLRPHLWTNDGERLTPSFGCNLQPPTPTPTHVQVGFRMLAF